MPFRIVWPVFVVLGMAASAGGQVVQQPRVIHIVPLQIQGTVAGVRPGGIMVTSAAKETWALKIPPQANVKITGTAEPDVLRAGMYVHFIASIDKRRNRVVDKVDRLTIFTPSLARGTVLGARYPGQQPAAGDNQKPAAQEEIFEIRGRLASLRRGRMTVHVPNRYFKPVLKAELAEDPAIAVDLSNYSLASPGDKIAAQGRQAGERMIEAMEVTIQLAKPLSNQRKRPKRRVAKPSAQQPSKEPKGRQPFEVAEQTEKDKEEKQGEEKEPQPGAPPQPDAAEKPPAQGDRTAQLTQLLEPQAVGAGAMQVTLNGVPHVFTACKQVPSNELTQKFGQPTQIFPANGSLPVGPGGAQQNVQWQLWIYDPVKLFVDKTGKTRYFSVAKQ